VIFNIFLFFLIFIILYFVRKRPFVEEFMYRKISEVWDIFAC